MPSITHHPRATLPATTLPWLGLRDHFVATVGERAGQGAPLGSLLVLADATFAPRSRFPLHPHRDMEILSVVVDGELSHHGDQAHGARLRARGAQLISARDGMFHAEGNDTDEPCRMLQLWIEPSAHGGAPAYFQRTAQGPGATLLAGDAGMPLRADVKVWWLDVGPTPTTLEVGPRRVGYLLALTGPVRVAQGPSLETGDGATVRGPVTLDAPTQGAVLWVDVAQPAAAAPRG